MNFYKETKSSSLNYTMLLKYSLTQTDSLAIKSLYKLFVFSTKPTQTEIKLF